jgi:hypothetical protein
MKVRKRLLAAVAVPAVAAGAVLAGSGVAHAATGYTDTSLQVSNFVWAHQVVGTAKATDGPANTVFVQGLYGAFQPGDSTNFAVSYAITGGADVDGVAVSVTNYGVGVNSYGVLTAKGVLNQGASSPTAATVTLTATDVYGDVAVVTVPVKVSDDKIVVGSTGATTDEVYSLTASDSNPNGSVLFAAKDTTDTPLASITEANLPAGLTSGNPLLAGTAVPGTYKDMLATATDNLGAKGTGSFELTVNGSKTPKAPVPVLSHGSASYVSPVRENVYFDTTISTWVHFQIVGPGAINGHEGWVYAVAGQLNKAVYGGLEANHTYTVYYTPVTGKGSTTQIPGTHTGYVVFVTNRP